MSASHLKIAHHHIYKCAGTTFATIIQKNFPGKVFHVEGENDDYRITGSDIKPCIALGDWHAVSSHLLTPPEPEDKLADLHVILLRDPVARLLSVFKYGKKIGQIPARVSLDEWVVDQSGIITDNFQARCCSVQSHADLSTRGGWSIDFESIDLTRKDLLIGSVELFDETMVVLEERARLLSIPFDASYPNPMNRTSAMTFSATEQRVIESLKARNGLDYALLERASTHILEELKQLDPSNDLVSDFKRRCASISEKHWRRFRMPPLCSWSWIKPESRHMDRKPPKPGAVALLKKNRDRPWARDWGPRQTHKGTGFNVQSNGNSALWIVGHNLDTVLQVYMGDMLLDRVSVRRDGEMLSVQVPGSLIATPGNYNVVAITGRDTCYPLGTFKVIG
jgi:hypothetical protein